MIKWTMKDFQVEIHRLNATRIVEHHYEQDLAPDEVLLEIDRFSMTANNITYGVVGERMRYWDFFPSAEGYGIIPVWGYANVVASNHPDVKVGERFYGYYPMSTHLLVNAGKVSSRGFVDISKHRKNLPPIYNYYTNTEHDSMYSVETENLMAVYRPLFTTSFLMDAHLAEVHFHKAHQIIITSASSKTAQALAFLLKQRKTEEDPEFAIVGLTSDRNKAFVEALGWYDEVVTYDHLDQLSDDEVSIIVDFTGNHTLQFRLQNQLGQYLVYNALVGIADWQHLRGEEILPRKGTFFFAPDYAVKFRKEWGSKEFATRVGASWQDFLASVKAQIEIKEYKGMPALQELYLEMSDGAVNPREGLMVCLAGAL